MEMSGKKWISVGFSYHSFTHKIDLNFYTLSIGNYTMDEQSWGWFADIDDEHFIDFVQTKEDSKKLTQHEEVSKKILQQPCSFIIQFFSTPFYYLVYFKYAFHLAQIQTLSQN